VNNSSEEKLLLRNQPEMPSYFKKDRVGRDEFLSQIGQFPEEQRSLFNRLCDMWEPDIPYSKFILKVGNDFLDVEKTLSSLINRLEKEGCGLFSMTINDGEIGKDRIILTDRSSPRFWYWKIENKWQECRTSDRKPFPVLKEFQDKKGFNTQIIQPLSLSEISSSFINEHINEVVIYALPDIDGKTLIVTPYSLQYLFDVARMKIRVNLSNSPILSVLARYTGTVPSNLIKDLEQDSNIFWNKLANAIMLHRDDLLVKKSNLNQEIFVAAGILKTYTKNEIEEAKKKREEEEEKQELLRKILFRIAEKENFLISAEDFNKQFAPYIKNWPDLRELFVLKYMQPPKRAGLPYIVSIGTDYIYRDHIYPMFKARHQAASAELKEYYTDVAERILRTRGKNRITVFSSLDSFREDIHDQLEKEFPILSNMLAKPRIVSEGIIHYVMKVMKSNDMEMVKTILARYFESGIIRFLDPEKLFNLSPVFIFREAFSRLNWFRKLILKLFGRYESYLQVFSNSPLKESGEKNKTAKTDGGNNFYSSAKTNQPAPYKPPPPERRNTAVQRKKRYTARQQEKAWEEFKTLYEKNKKKEK